MATLDLSKYTGIATGSFIGYSTNSADTIENGYSLFTGAGITSESVDLVGKVSSITGGWAVSLSGSAAAGEKAVTEVNVGSSSDAWSILGDQPTASHVKTIKTGAGNDTVEMVQVDDSATINTGAGDDTVSVSVASGSMNIEMGDGADSLVLEDAEGALTVNAGSGKNEVSIGTAKSTFSFTGGDDADTVSLASVEKEAELTLGSGANDVSIGTASSNLTISAGDGSDSINVTKVEGNAVINAGDGNNFVSLAEVSGTLNVTGGSGKDSVSIGKVEKDATIALGDGADTLKIAGNVEGLLTITGDGEGANYVSVGSEKLDKGVSIAMGSGKDSIIIDKTTVSGSISLGDGKDNLSLKAVEKATISGGSGDKVVSIGNVTEGSIALGNGKDTVEITKVDSTTVDLGDGRDNFYLKSALGSTINMGADNDFISIGGSGTKIDSTTINLGDGKDTIYIDDNTKVSDVTLAGGAGADVFSITGSNINGTVTISDFEVGTDTLYAGLTSPFSTTTAKQFTSEGQVSLSSTAKIQLAGSENYAVTTAIGNEAVNIAWTGENASMIDASSFTKNAILIGDNNADTSDTLFGGTKADTIFAGANDYVYGGAGNDSIVVTSGTDTTYVGFTKNGGKDSVTGFGSDDVVYLFENSVSDISKITTGGSSTVLKMGTATLTLENGAKKFKVRDTSGSDYNLQVVDSVGGGITVSKVDDMADIYYAADSKATLNFSSVNDKLVVDLGNTGIVTNTNNAQYLGKFASVKGGSDDTILMGAGDVSESLEAGAGATTIWGGGSKSDTMIHSNTDNSAMFVFGEGDGKDSVVSSNWGSKESNDVLWLNGGTISSIKNDGTDTTIALTSGDKVTLSKKSDVDTAIKFTTDGGATVSQAKIGKSGVANDFTYSSDVAVYVGGSGNKLTVGSDVDTANIWLDGSQGVSYDSFKTVDAHTSSGDIIIAGTGSTNESLVASRGNSSLWGGAGSSNDTLSGTTGGTTTYFWGNGDGKDVITGSHSDDVVNLYNVALSDIADLNTTSTSMEITLNDGSALTISNMSSSSVKTFKLSDGSTWEYSTSTKSWTQA